MNELITDMEFFHRLIRDLFLAIALMLSNICLLMRPISLFAGLISLQDVCFENFFYDLHGYEGLLFCHALCSVLYMEVCGNA